MSISSKSTRKGQGNVLVGVDLFCGAGGMSLGFEQAGFRVAAAVDISGINVKVHEKNFPRSATICDDIRKLTGAAIRKKARIENKRIDVVFGGPPCQGFSVGGIRRPRDPRNTLLLEFARLVVELGPRYFVMENVGGLLGDRYAPLLNKFKKVLRDGGYSIVDPLIRLDAAEFGVPQRRRRVFILGCRKNEKSPSYPKPGAVQVTVGAAINDLKVVHRSKLRDGDSYSGPLGAPSAYAKRLRQPRERAARATTITGVASTKHSADVVERFTRVKQGSVDPISRFIRLRRKSIAPTLRAGTGSENGRFMAPRPIHPDYPRCISVREAARLHSFPDWFEFHGTKWNGFMQVGNSVPPILARVIAEEVRRSIESQN